MATLVTGANRGIGLALVKTLRADGRRVIGTARNTPAGADWARLDVTDPGSHKALAEALSGEPIELLVCNAGIYPDRGQVIDGGYAPALWEEAFATNVTGVFLTIQSLIGNLRAAKGRIAIISSQMASQERAPGGSYIYRASKAAVVNLGRNLAKDLMRDGIAVGIYHPGWVQTDMGGAGADLNVETAARGLAERFEALTLATSGCFETWDGRVHPF